MCHTPSQISWQKHTGMGKLLLQQLTRPSLDCPDVPHSLPDFVAKAYWNGEVAASTAGAMVLTTSLRTMSPHTMPRTPPPGFSKAVNLPMRSNVNTSGGTCPLANSCAARLKDDVSGTGSRMTSNRSAVTPEGPAAAPRRALRMLRANNSGSNTKGLTDPTSRMS